MNYVDISWFDLGLTFFLVVLVLLISLRSRLGLERDLLLGSLRAFVQLILVGYLLQFVFDTKRWYLVLLILAAMITVAGANAAGRQKRKLPGGMLLLTLAIAAGGILTLAIVTRIVLRIEPWYTPRYLIPLAGMIVGNAMTGSALCLNRLQSELDLRRAEVEAALSLGATYRQAADLSLREALRAAMLPTIMSMMTVGLVQLPGMMTGQIIAGTSPAAAVRYQIMVVYMIAAATGITCIVVVQYGLRKFFTPAHQLHLPQ